MKTKFSNFPGMSEILILKNTTIKYYEISTIYKCVEKQSTI